MNQYNDPTWWTEEYESGWERAKAAFKRDWDQTKHDMGGDEPDTDQDVNDTVKQAAGKQSIPPRGQPNYEELEPAYRYGFGARSYYSDDYPEWDDELEAKIEKEWRASYPSRANRWQQDSRAIRHAWDYAEAEATQK